MDSAVKKRGFYANGRQRWFCHRCKRSFHWGTRSTTHGREKIWFKRWIVEGYSIRQLADQSGKSKAKLRRIINHWLSQSPTQDKRSLEELKYMIFDGTFIHRPVSIIALMDGLKNSIVKAKYGVSENSEPQLRAFFAPLKERGLLPESITTDGNPQAIRVIRSMWPDITIQRCLVHIQRQGLMWCRRNPKTDYAKDLRDIFLGVTYIYTKDDRDRFLEAVFRWEDRYGGYIGSQPERGKVFSDIKRARSMLLRALPDMFHYLNDTSIPPTTNGLEGYFSRLKTHYRSHRGLSPAKRINYFDWYFNLRPR